MQMTKVGPFWREKPTAATNHAEFCWCYIYLGRWGNVVAIEWLS